MKNITRLCCLAMASLSLVAVTTSAPAAAPAKIKVLIITGDDVGSHPWGEVTQATRETLVASGKFDVKVCEDPGILESAASLKRYDVIYMDYYNANTPTISDAAKENLVSYIKGGKGFVLAHLTSASFKEWTEFQKIAGRYWVMGKSGHGPRSVFKVNIADKTHGITQGAEDFETDDELYAKLLGDVPIHILATADSDWSKKTEPLAFTLEYGQGRVFNHAFGHDGKAVRTPGVQKLIVRGTEWAARGKVE